MRKNDKEKEFEEEKKLDERTSNNKRSSSRKPQSRRNYKGKEGNDIGWHAKSQQLLNDCASVPWSYSTGRDLIRSHVGTHSELADGHFVLPGIFAMKTVLTPGVSTTQSDAINVAAQAMYTDIRSQLKSANAYDSSDVMIYMCEMAEIKAFIAFIRRILGTPLNYSFMNSFLPDALIRAQGVNPDGIHAHYAEYRSRANQIIAKASQIWWPKGFDYVTRAEWEYGNYYTEGESIKDQIYMFTPGLFRKFTYDEERDYAGMLQPCIKFNFGALHTMDDLLDALSDMIDSVVGDSDFQNIAGDLFNRYGAGGVETFSLIPESYIINPALSFEVLEQIQNSKCLTFVKDTFDAFTVGTRNTMFDVAQDEARNMLLVENKYSVDVLNADTRVRMEADLYAPIFTVDKNPDVTKTMLITRCANVVTNAELADIEGGIRINFTYDVAMELVVGYDYYWISETGVLQRVASSTANLRDWSRLVIISPFHYHPLHDIAVVTEGKNGPYPLVCGSIDTYAVISPEQIKDMNRVDLMSLFAVPNVGSVNK